MIYLDNGATSYPKPTNVLLETQNALKYFSFNSGRGGYKESINSAEKIFSVREKVGNMFGYLPQNVVFTKNCTEALNAAIKGVVNRGEHIIISSIEHNAVFRTVYALADSGYAEFDVADFSYDENETVTNFESKIKSNTSLIVCMHASNVFGVVFPVEKIARLADKYKVKFIVDAAQSAGVLPLNGFSSGIDILCAPGHKSLYGSMGSGFFAVKDGLQIKPFIQGGTGSDSVNSKQPDFLPDRFESGTLNNSGIVSLGAGIDFINKKGRANIYNHEMRLISMLYDELNAINNVKLYTPKPVKNSFVPLLSFNYGDYSSEHVAAYLGEHNIAVRAGIHCAPLAHKYFGTLNTGTVRICPSVFTNERECEFFINTIKKL